MLNDFSCLLPISLFTTILLVVFLLVSLISSENTSCFVITSYHDIRQGQTGQHFGLTPSLKGDERRDWEREIERTDRQNEKKMRKGRYSYQKNKKSSLGPVPLLKHEYVHDASLATTCSVEQHFREPLSSTSRAPLPLPHSLRIPFLI
jgi:hypothetical protein